MKILNKNKINIGVLTSSRADYAIYKPLLYELNNDNRFKVTIIVFGMHLQGKYGKTINIIKSDNFGEIHEVEGMPKGDTPLSISKGYANLVNCFSDYWNSNNFKNVLCLGDRFEMSAAVQAGVLFNVNFIHLHGGETTLGAVDNIYRHQISLASKIHIVASDIFLKRLSGIIGSKKDIFNFGALSLDGIDTTKIIDWESICKEFNIPNEKFILVTFHPETVEIENNFNYCKVIFKVLKKISSEINIVVTLPNADSMNMEYRKIMLKLKNIYPDRFTLVENFGKEKYFSAIANSELMLGNSSSGILEAATFKRYVLNVGKRQKGRLKNENVFDIPFDADLIYEKYKLILKLGDYRGENIFFKKNTSNNIIKVLASG